MNKILKGGVIDDGVQPGGVIGSPDTDGLGLNKPTDIKILTGGSIYEFNEVGQPIATLGVEPEGAEPTFSLLPVDDYPDNALVTIDGNSILAATEYDTRSVTVLKIGVRATVEEDSLDEEMFFIILEDTNYKAPTRVFWESGGVIEGLNQTGARIGTLGGDGTDVSYSIASSADVSISPAGSGNVVASRQFPNPTGVQTYTLQVVARNRRGSFTLPISFRVTEKDVPVILPPSNLRITEENGFLSLRWDAVPDAVFYRIEMADNAQFDNEKNSSLPAPPFTTPTFDPETKYYFRIKSVDSDFTPTRESGYSGVLEYTTKKEVIALKQRFLLSPTVGLISGTEDNYVSLNKTANNSAYKLKDVDGQDTSIFFGYATAPTGISSSGTVTGSDSGRYPDFALREYFYTDKEIKFALSGIEWPFVTIRLLGSRVDIPDRKALFSVDGKYRKNQELRSVQDNRNNVLKVTSFTDLQPIGQLLEFSFDNAPDVEFGYLNVIEIECYDKATGEPTDGIGENIPDVTQPPTPTIKEPENPTITVQTISATEQKLSWPEYTGATYVTQRRSPGGSGGYENVGFPPAGVTSQSFKDLTPNTNYEYRVRYSKYKHNADNFYFTAPVSAKTLSGGAQPPTPSPGMPTNGKGGAGIQTINYALPSGLQRGKFDIPSNYKILWDNDVKARLTSVLNSSGHGEEKNRIEGSDNNPVVRAMRYVRDNNVSDGVLALSWLNGFLSGGGSSRDSYGPSSELAMAGLIHSWCKDLYSRSDTPNRNTMVDLLNKWCYQNTTDQYDSPIMPNGTKNAIFSNNRTSGNVKFIVSHHMSHLSSIFLAAIAIADDDDTIYRQVRDVIIDEMVPAKCAMQQGGAIQGVQYSVARQCNDAVVAMVLSHIAKVNGQSNTKYFPEECFNAGRTMLYSTRPDGQLIKFGDTFHYPPAPNYEWVRWLVSGAVAAKDSELLDFAYDTWYNGSGMVDADKNGHVVWAPLLLAQRDLQRKNYKMLPTFRQTDYPAGSQIIRGGFGIEKNKRVVNEYLFATYFNANVHNHLPPAQGNMHTHWKGQLETMSGAYTSTTGEYGSQHVTNWFQTTPAYSIFYSQNSNFEDRVRNGNSVNLGGQMFNEPPITLDDVKNRNVHDTIKVSRMWTEEGLAVGMIDTTQAEDSRYVSLVRRVYAAVATGNAELPLIVFSQDYFINKDNNTTNVVLAHGIGDIDANNTEKRFSITNRESYKGMLFEGKETGWVFGNGDVFSWTGYHSERNSLGNPSGTQYPPGDPKSSFNGDYWKETSGKRADIRTTGRSSSEIKIWRTIGDYDATFDKPTERSNGAFKYYERFGLVIGVMDGQTLVNQVSFNLSNARRVILLCLNPAAKYRDQNGKEYNLKGGFLFDEQLNAGNYTLTKV